MSANYTKHCSLFIMKFPTTWIIPVTFLGGWIRRHWRHTDVTYKTVRQEDSWQTMECTLSIVLMEIKFRKGICWGSLHRIWKNCASVDLFIYMIPVSECGHEKNISVKLSKTHIPWTIHSSDSFIFPLPSTLSIQVSSTSASHMTRNSCLEGGMHSVVRFLLPRWTV